MNGLAVRNPFPDAASVAGAREGGAAGTVLDMTFLPDLQGWIDQAAQRHGVPGAAVAVGMGDRLAEGATGVKATADSLFQIGSVTKVWTAALVMQLVGEGQGRSRRAGPAVSSRVRRAGRRRLAEHHRAAVAVAHRRVRR